MKRALPPLALASLAILVWKRGELSKIPKRMMEH